MAEEKLDEVEQALPSKRKLPSPELESPQNSSKLQKLQPNSPANSPITNKQNGTKYEDEEEEEEEDDYEESEDEDDEEDGGGEIDRKGKGVMKEDVKGKGKLIEESENDSSDDDDDDDEVGSGFEEEDESDLDEDPLAEVDLGNILPSRTRGRGGRNPPRSGVTFSDNDSKDHSK